MNIERRKRIDGIIERLQTLAGELAEVQESIESVRDEEQEYHDNMPESLQNGERREKATEAIDRLEEAMYEIDGLDLSGIVSILEDAQGRT